MLRGLNIVVVVTVALKLWTALAHISQHQHKHKQSQLQFKTLNVIDMRSKENKVNDRGINEGKRS